MAATKRKRKFQCVRRKTKTVIQDYGPAKKVKTCAKRVPFNSKEGRAFRKKGGKGKSRYCVFRGKSPVAMSCHLKKSAANKAAARARKSCKAKRKCVVNVKKKTA